MSDQLIGASLAKTIGVAGVIAVLGSAALMMKGSSVQDETLFLTTTLVPEARAMIRNDTNTSNATGANLVAQGRIPTSRVSGTNVTSSYGTVTVASANVTGAANDGFTVAYPAALGTKECNDFAQGLAQFANTITVNSTSVKANGANINSTTLATACGTAPASITFGFSKAGS